MLTLAAFRRLLRQDAFYHQTPNEPKSVSRWIDTLLAAVAQDAPQELAVPFFRAIRSVPRCKVTTNAVGCLVFFLSILTPCTFPRVFAHYKKTAVQVTELPSSRLIPCFVLSFKKCNETRPRLNRMWHYKYSTVRAGNIMCSLPLPRRVLLGTSLSQGFSGIQRSLCSLMAQHITTSKLEALVPAFFEISAQGLQLLDWGCLALLSCKDNIIAEVMGADLALRLYERYVKTCQGYQLSPLLLDRIQGDIKPLISHLQFQGRFRRPDLTSVIDPFHQKRSRIAPLSTTEYRPREVNFVADYLAGQGSAYLLDLRQSQSQLPVVPVYLNVAPP